MKTVKRPSKGQPSVRGFCERINFSNVRRKIWIMPRGEIRTNAPKETRSLPRLPRRHDNVTRNYNHREISPQQEARSDVTLYTFSISSLSLLPTEKIRSKERGILAGTNGLIEESDNRSNVIRPETLGCKCFFPVEPRTKFQAERRRER